MKGGNVKKASLSGNKPGANSACDGDKVAQVGAGVNVRKVSKMGSAASPDQFGNPKRKGG